MKKNHLLPSISFTNIGAEPTATGYGCRSAILQRFGETGHACDWKNYSSRVIHAPRVPKWRYNKNRRSTRFDF